MENSLALWAEVKRYTYCLSQKVYFEVYPQKTHTFAGLGDLLPRPSKGGSAAQKHPVTQQTASSFRLLHYKLQLQRAHQAKPLPFQGSSSYPHPVSEWGRAQRPGHLSLMYLLQTCLPDLPRHCQAYTSAQLLSLPNPASIPFPSQVLVPKSFAYPKFHLSMCLLGKSNCNNWC